jgi:hypothetical protein
VRDLLLRVLVMLGACTLLLTEGLSLFHWIRPFPLAGAWLGIGAGGAGSSGFPFGRLKRPSRR